MNNIMYQEGLLSLYMSMVSNDKIVKLLDPSISMSNDDSNYKSNKLENTPSTITNTDTLSSNLISENFEQKSNLNELSENINTYPKEDKKQFVCPNDDCKKKFDYKWILDRHINSHFCFKLFKCEYENCNKTYKSKENLTLHIKNKHLGEKPYKCRFCDSRFSHRNGKKKINFFNILFYIGKTYHERRIHINYLPYHCDVKDCLLRFACKSALNYHKVNQHKYNDNNNSSNTKGF